jgi:hypothetical protein
LFSYPATIAEIAVPKGVNRPSLRIERTLFERSEFMSFPQGRPVYKAISAQVLIFWYFFIKEKVHHGQYSLAAALFYLKYKRLHFDLMSTVKSSPIPFGTGLLFSPSLLCV